MEEHNLKFYLRILNEVSTIVSSSTYNRFNQLLERKFKQRLWYNVRFTEKQKK